MAATWRTTWPRPQPGACDLQAATPPRTLVCAGAWAATAYVLGGTGPRETHGLQLNALQMLMDREDLLGDAPDAARARVLLSEVGPFAAEPLYPRLAEAAVLLSEGQRAEALAALQQWEERSLSGGRASMWRTGNQWALERLHAAL